MKFRAAAWFSVLLMVAGIGCGGTEEPVNQASDGGEEVGQQREYDVEAEKAADDETTKLGL